MKVVGVVDGGEKDAATGADDISRSGNAIRHLPATNVQLALPSPSFTSIYAEKNNESAGRRSTDSDPSSSTPTGKERQETKCAKLAVCVLIERVQSRERGAALSLCHQGAT